MTLGAAEIGVSICIIHNSHQGRINASPKEQRAAEIGVSIVNYSKNAATRCIISAAAAAS